VGLTTRRTSSITVRTSGSGTCCNTVKTSATSKVRSFAGSFDKDSIARNSVAG
jgi:hypothetical protein